MKIWKRVFRAVHFPVLAISEIACIKVLTKTGLLKRVVTISELDDSLGQTGAKCSVDSSSVMIAASSLLQDDVERL